MAGFLFTGGQWTVSGSPLAIDSAVTHLAGIENITGYKAFSGGLTVLPQTVGGTAAFLLDNQNGQQWLVADNNGGQFSFYDNTNSKTPFLIQPNSLSSSLIIGTTGITTAVFSAPPVIGSISNTGTLTLPTSTDTLVGRATTDTLSNKRLTRRAVTVAQSATISINTDTTDLAAITGLAQTSTISTTGTPVAGDLLTVQITDTGTARTVTFSATNFESSGTASSGGYIALPVGTQASVMQTVVFAWNPTTSKWRVQSVTGGGTLFLDSSTSQTITGSKTFSTAPVLNVLPTGTAVAAAGTASTIVTRDGNTNLTAGAFIPGFTPVATAAGTTTLVIGSKENIQFTGTTTQTCVLSTAGVAIGQKYTIINSSTGLVTVQASGATTIQVIASNTVATFYALAATPTLNTQWYADCAATPSGAQTLTNKTITYATNTITGLPYDLSYLQAISTRAVGYGDNPIGIKVQRACTFTSVTFRVNTADASGNLVVELRKNGATVAGTSTTIASTSQVAGGTTTGSWAFAIGDILTVYTSAIGTTPGTGLTADITGNI